MESLRASVNELNQKNGLLDIVEAIDAPRGQCSVRYNPIYNLFSGHKDLWKQIVTKKGHAHFKNRFTGISIGFQSHGNGNSIPSTQAKTMADQLKEHINLLATKIFECEVETLKSGKVDFELVEQRYREQHSSEKVSPKNKKVEQISKHRPGKKRRR